MENWNTPSAKASDRASGEKRAWNRARSSALPEAGACGTVEQRAQQVPGRGLGVQCLSGGQIQPGGGQTGPGLPAVPGGQLPEVFRSRPAASHIFRFAQQTVHISGFIE